LLVKLIEGIVAPLGICVAPVLVAPAVQVDVVVVPVVVLVLTTQLLAPPPPPTVSTR
jgi:hypothetical protein